ncbi:MAG TPA: hypothetical protein VH370_15635 [Humisphaera sp.]|jgi:hypothetical protein|nr:hypothetical protein [Humisphaera sp.]
MADLTPVWLSIVDKAMDTHGQFDVGVNTLPSKCEHCTFPDLDFVPEPYALARGLDSSKEIEVLSLGNLVVRPRVRKILADAVGDQVSFHPTCHWKNSRTDGMDTRGAAGAAAEFVVHPLREHAALSQVRRAAYRSLFAIGRNGGLGSTDNSGHMQVAAMAFV